MASLNGATAVAPGQTRAALDQTPPVHPSASADQRLAQFHSRRDLRGLPLKPAQTAGGEPGQIGGEQTRRVARVSPGRSQRHAVHGAACPEQGQRRIAKQAAVFGQRITHGGPEREHPHVITARVLVAKALAAQAHHVALSVEPDRALAQRSRGHPQAERFGFAVCQELLDGRRDQNISVPHQHRGARQMRAGAGHAARGTTNLRLDQHAHLRCPAARGQGRRELLGQMVHVDDQLTDPRGLETRQRMRQNRAVPDWHERLGQFVGQRARSRVPKPAHRMIAEDTGAA